MSSTFFTSRTRWFTIVSAGWKRFCCVVLDRHRHTCADARWSVQHNRDQQREARHGCVTQARSVQARESKLQSEVQELPLLDLAPLYALPAQLYLRVEGVGDLTHVVQQRAHCRRARTSPSHTSTSRPWRATGVSDGAAGVWTAPTQQPRTNFGGAGLGNGEKEGPQVLHESHQLRHATAHAHGNVHS